MRKVFADWLVTKAIADPNIILIVGDIGFGLFDEYRELFPDRFINIGICEQSMISVAAGMALEGWKPYVYTITPFLIERPYEQIKIDIYQNNANVKLIGYADYPKQGLTHCCHSNYLLNDVLDCWFPGSESYTKRALNMTYNNKEPAFISLRRNK